MPLCTGVCVCEFLCLQVFVYVLLCIRELPLTPSRPFSQLRSEVGGWGEAKIEEGLLVDVSLLAWNVNISCCPQKLFATCLDLGGATPLCQLSLS